MFRLSLSLLLSISLSLSFPLSPSFPVCPYLLLSSSLALSLSLRLSLSPSLHARASHIADSSHTVAEAGGLRASVIRRVFGVPPLLFFSFFFSSPFSPRVNIADRGGRKRSRDRERQRETERDRERQREREREREVRFLECVSREQPTRSSGTELIRADRSETEQGASRISRDAMTAIRVSQSR